MAESSRDERREELGSRREGEEERAGERGRKGGQTQRDIKAVAVKKNKKK